MSKRRAELEYAYLICDACSKNRKRLRKNNLNYVYYESHHIVPECFGGSNHRSNKVLLTAREHFIAHQLLVEIHQDDKQKYYKMVRAWNYMAHGNKKHFENEITAEEYEVLRIMNSQAVSDNYHSKTDEEKRDLYKNRKSRKGIPQKPEAVANNVLSKNISFAIKRLIKNNYNSIWHYKYANISYENDIKILVDNNIPLPKIGIPTRKFKSLTTHESNKINQAIKRIIKNTYIGPTFKLKEDIKFITNYNIPCPRIGAPDISKYIKILGDIF